MYWKLLTSLLFTGYAWGWRDRLALFVCLFLLAGYSWGGVTDPDPQLPVPLQMGIVHVCTAYAWPEFSLVRFVLMPSASRGPVVITKHIVIPNLSDDIENSGFLLVFADYFWSQRTSWLCSPRFRFVLLSDWKHHENWSAYGLGTVRPNFFTVGIVLRNSTARRHCPHQWHPFSSTFNGWGLSTINYGKSYFYRPSCNRFLNQLKLTQSYPSSLIEVKRVYALVHGVRSGSGGALGGISGLSIGAVHLDGVRRIDNENHNADGFYPKSNFPRLSPEIPPEIHKTSFESLPAPIRTIAKYAKIVFMAVLALLFVGFGLSALQSTFPRSTGYMVWISILVGIGFWVVAFLLIWSLVSSFDRDYSDSRHVAMPLSLSVPYGLTRPLGPSGASA